MAGGGILPLPNAEEGGPSGPSEGVLHFKTPPQLLNSPPLIRRGPGGGYLLFFPEALRYDRRRFLPAPAGRPIYSFRSTNRRSPSPQRGRGWSGRTE